EGGLVAFAAIWDWGQIGRVGFDQHAVERDLHSRIANLLRLGKGDVARKGNHEAHVEGAFGLRPVSGEAVENASQAARRPLLFDKPEAVLPGIIAVIRRA